MLCIFSALANQCHWCCKRFRCHFQHQVLLPLLDSDLFDVALGCAEGNLKARVPEVDESVSTRRSCAKHGNIWTCRNGSTTYLNTSQYITAFSRKKTCPTYPRHIPWISWIPLSIDQVRWKPGAAATVVCAAKGYPGSYPKGFLALESSKRTDNKDKTCQNNDNIW